MSENPPTICKCGSAKSYHGERHQRDHEYEPRYEPVAWREGYRAAQAAALDVDVLARALAVVGWIGTDATQQAEVILTEYRAILAGEVDRE